MKIEEIIDYYHGLLDESLAESTDALMRQRLKTRGLYFGERPICTVLRPHFYFEDDWQFIKHSLQTLLQAFSRAHEVCMNSSEARAQLRLQPYEEALYHLDVGGPPPWSSSRLDTFFEVSTRTLKCVEYNAETPAGLGYDDMLIDTFEELEPMKRLEQRYHVHPLQGMGHLHTAIINAYHQWGGRGSPRIAIVDWHEVPTLHEHEIIRIYFEKQGIRTILADPRHLEYRDGKLWHEDFHINLIYKRVLYNELVDRIGLDNPILNAVRDRNVFITNAPSAKLMSKKASFAFLSDERNSRYFTRGMLTAIAANIPWTRVVEDRRTLHNGVEVDLLQFALDHQQTMVLKPNDEYGGTGVVLGWDVSAEVWQETLKHAQEIPFVLQERAPSVRRSFPAWIDGKLDFSLRYVDAAPYIFEGQRVEAVLTRLSSGALLNVTAGGGSVVPCYIVSDK